MRFVLLYKSGKAETNEPPSPKEMEAVGRLVQEMAQAGVLLGTEGFEPSTKGARVRMNAGKFTVSDGPFTDRNGLIDGYAVVKVKSKSEAIEWSQRFLAAVGEGASEVRQLREMVLIRVRANSLNAREVSVLNGTYPRTGQVLTVAAAPRVGWP